MKKGRPEGRPLPTTTDYRPAFAPSALRRGRLVSCNRAAAEGGDGADQRLRVDRLGEVQLESGFERLLAVLVARERRERGCRDGRNGWRFERAQLPDQ